MRERERKKQPPVTFHHLGLSEWINTNYISSPVLHQCPGGVPADGEYQCFFDLYITSGECNSSELAESV